ncbi:MAG: AAA family ATPase, partial [Candidatus Desulfofervidus auxilii]|nr:AAA family ATPase [Candidatus Desulfofervidus auxilii]
MRIKKIRIKNFLSIIDSGKISLDNEITILLGKNEQGKTNFLKALESFGKEYKYGDDDLSYLVTHGKELQKMPIITIWFKLNDDEKKILSSISEEFEEQSEVVITKYFDGHYEIVKPELGKIQSKIEEIKLFISKILKENKNKINKSFAFLNQIDKNKHINWLKLLQTPDGGFSHIPG